MAILGYDTKDTTSSVSFTAGRLSVSKFTLAAGATMTELHGWFARSSAGTENIELAIYADSAAVPGSRVAYSSPIALPGTNGDYELSQTGFSVPLTAGDYWIGFRPSASGGLGVGYMNPTTGTHAQIDGASSPPPNPFGTPSSSGTRKFCCWAVVGAAAAAFVPQVILT